MPMKPTLIQTRWTDPRLGVMFPALPPMAALCYVDGPWAWFTTQDYRKQWGDDWADAPYEHNAGEPYRPLERDRGWEVFQVAFCGEFRRPCDGYDNSPYSVEMINGGAVAWLASPAGSEHRVNIVAGTTLRRFLMLVGQAGGMVYLPCSLNASSYDQVVEELRRRGISGEDV